MLKIVDVGAMDVGEVEPWARLVDSSAACLFGFEPNDDEYKKLTAAGRPNTEYLPHALGDGTAHTLYVGAAP